MALTKRVELVRQLLNEGLTVKQVAESMGTDTSNIYRDIRQLRELGMPVLVRKRAKGYAHRFPDWYFLLLGLMGQGLTVSAAARQLGKRPRGCFTALANMRRYLKMDSNLQMVAWAFRAGVLSDDCVPGHEIEVRVGLPG